MNNMKRYDELSLKLMKIGEALIIEGEEKDDYTILNLGNFIIFIASLVYEEEDIKLFSEICGMMAAKKMAEDSEIMQLLTSLSFTELQEVIEKIRKDREE